MNTTVKAELANYILNRISYGFITNANIDDWHNIAFNTDYYIVGQFDAIQWLKSHDIDAFEAIEIVRDYEMDNLGEFITKINAEAIVNMLVYICGEELIYSDNYKSVNNLKRGMKLLTSKK